MGMVGLEEVRRLILSLISLHLSGVTGNGQFLYENQISAIFGEKYTLYKSRVNRATNSRVPVL